jgi:Arc/MetJ family transcription regulator
MPTNILLDEALLEEAMGYASVKSERELVDLALREFVANRRRRDMRELFGKVQIDPDYDYKAVRVGTGDREREDA